MYIYICAYAHVKSCKYMCKCTLICMARSAIHGSTRDVIPTVGRTSLQKFGQIKGFYFHGLVVDQVGGQETTNLSCSTQT